MLNYMCICWLINWNDSTKMHGATIRFIVTQHVVRLTSWLLVAESFLRSHFFHRWSINSPQIMKPEVSRSEIYHSVSWQVTYSRKELLAPRSTSMLEDHSLSAVCHCLSNILAATLHTWRPSPLTATWVHAISWRRPTYHCCLSIVFLTNKCFEMDHRLASTHNELRITAFSSDFKKCY